jgi:hypothetical protein
MRISYLCYKILYEFRNPAAIFVSSFLIGLSGALMPGPLLAVTIRDTTRRGFHAPLLVLGTGSWNWDSLRFSCSA